MRFFTLSLFILSSNLIAGERDIDLEAKINAAAEEGDGDCSSN